jgi:hypothetical protein
MSKKKSNTSKTKIVSTQTLSKDFKKYLLLGLTLTNSSIWILSYLQIGYDLTRSLGGDSKFSDFTMAIYYAPIFFDPRLLNTQPPFDYGMTPPLALFFGAINPNYWSQTLFTLNLLALVTIYYYISKILKFDSFVILIFMNSFPIVFCILRGSADLWLLALLLLSFYSFTRGHPIRSALLLGFLVACKPHFAVFGLMYLINRDWKSIGVLGTSSIAFFLSPLLWLNNFGVINQLRVFLQISRNYQNTYAVGDGGLMWDNGFISFLR